jgi:inhibitor of cysteine peptidase
MKRSTLLIIIASLVVIVGVILLIVFTSGNTYRFSNDDQVQGDMVVQEANVGDIEIELLESFPVQVIVKAFGTLPDGCTEIGTVTQEHDGNTFDILIETERPRNAVCTQAIRQFEQPVALDVDGLLKGEYLVNINGVQETFSLEMDNIIDFEAGDK